jgi:hypothetical protein
LCAQRLAGEGQGEQGCVRAMLGQVAERVLAPLKLKGQALALLDSLHGDQTTLKQLEQARLHYVVGANKLARTTQTLAELSELAWQNTGARRELNWSASGVCACWLQCEQWEDKRLLVGRRWMREGEMIWNNSGVLTDLREKDVRAMMERGLSFAQAVWELYDFKAGMETLLKDGLSDLGLHHPPCQQHQRNSGFYALGALAWLLAGAVNIIGGHKRPGARPARRNRNRRRRMARMRLWRLRRELFTLPGRVARHARELRVQLLGLGEAQRRLFTHYWDQICRC